MNAPAVIKHISSWLQDYVHQSGTLGFVVGISGGIDSAVTSTLAATTGLPVLCVEMPIHQPADQVSRAADHIAFLKQKYSNVSAVEAPLTSVYESFVAAVPSSDDSEKEGLALANSRARLRMTTLYYFAGIHSYLVLGTGNKVEDFGVGFFTKYGDGGVDLSPIADLVKSEVYALGKELGVHHSILEAKPTDGLWGDDRTDEDQLGASYPELEWAMRMVEEGKEGMDHFSDREKEVMKIYTRLNGANQHKMVPIPVCIIPASLK